MISCPQPIGRCRWHPKICRPIWRLLFEAPILHGRPTASWHPQLVSHWLSKEHARAGWDGTFSHFFSVLVGTAHFTRHTRCTKTHDRYPPCPKLNWFLVSSQSGVGPALNTHASSSSHTCMGLEFGGVPSTPRERWGARVLRPVEPDHFSRCRTRIYI